MRATSISGSELRNRARLAFLLMLPFLLLILLVSPRGDFPLNDDWVYAKMVLRLVNEGHFGLSPFSNAFALTQVLYAAPLVKIFGFSFTLLRLTTIFMAWVTVCMVAFTARELGLSNRAALLAALTVLVNPIFINLSYTFMTDVPFCALLSISVYFFVKAQRRPEPALLLLASLFAVIAFFERQFAAIVPLAFVAAIWTREKREAWSLRNIAALVVPWGGAAILLLCLPGPEIRFETARTTHSELNLSGLKLMALAIGPFGLGVAAIPIAAYLVLDALGRPVKERQSVVAAPILALLAYFAVRIGETSVVSDPGQILRYPSNVGAGPILFIFRNLYLDVSAYAIAQSPPFPGALAGSILIAASFAIGAIAFFRKRKGHPVRRVQLFFLKLTALAMGGMPFITMQGAYFDRYLLPTASVGVLVLAAGMQRRPGRLSVVGTTFFCAALFSFSTIALQDYMAWNTARWQAVDMLRTKHHAQDNEINAGYEFNGMYTSDEYVRRLRETPDQHLAEWWVLGEKYAVSPVDLSPRDPSKCVERVPYYSWLGFETRQLYVLKW